MKEERKITKKHIFNYEMKYKELLKGYTTCNFENGLNLDLLDDLTKSFFNFPDSISDELCFEFLNDFKDIINWYLFFDVVYDDEGETICRNLYDGLLNSSENLEKFLDKYTYYIDKEIGCWRIISQFGTFNENIIRKYKDKLDWYYVSEHYTFTKEFFLEIKDYIQINKYLARGFGIPFDNIVNFIKDHLEEAATYERKETKNGN